MKLQEIIERLDKSVNELEYSGVSEDLYTTLGLAVEYDSAPRLTAYFFGKHLCTDTHVGYKVYFLDDIFVCCSAQLSRKCNEKFYWKDNQSIDNVRNYLLSLKCYPIEHEFCDVTEEYGEGYSLVKYREQFIFDSVLIDIRNNEPVENMSYNKKIERIDVAVEHPVYNSWEPKRIEIKHFSGRTEIVDCEQLLSPYKIT